MRVSRAAVIITVVGCASTGGIHAGGGDETLIIRTDSSLYRLAPSPWREGDHVLRMVVSLENRSRDTILLSFPCHFGPTVARTFLRSDDSSLSVWNSWACVAVGPDTHGFAIPPQSIVRDSFTVVAFGYRAGEHEVRLDQYLGPHRVTYARRIKRVWWRWYGWRRYWTHAPLHESMSNEFRIEGPG